MDKPALEYDKNNGVLQISGPLTVATAAELYRQLQTLLAELLGDKLTPASLTLDCSRIAGADSAVIGLLLEAHRQVTGMDKSLAIIGLQEKMISLVRIYGVEWILPAEA